MISLPVQGPRAPRRAARWSLPVVFGLFLAGPVGAQTAPDSNWALSGFGSLGLTAQSGGHDWGLQRNSSQRGAGADVSASQDSRLGLQLDWHSGNQWEGAAQVVATNKPSGTPFGENIEWGYVGYRPLPNTRIRVGRTSPDVFLFADSRNVGFALPWARPPIDFYGFAPVVSVDGADVEQRWSLDESTWRVRATAGSFRAGVTDALGARLQMRGSQVWALGVTREEGGLLLKASYLQARLRLQTPPELQLLQQGLDQVAQLGLPGVTDSIDALGDNLWNGGGASYLALAAQYDTGPWSFVAEASELTVRHSPLSGRRAYASIGYRTGAVTWYGLVSRVVPSRSALTEPDLVTPLAPVIGEQAAQQAQALAGYAADAGLLYRFDQTTLAAGLRWDVATNTAVKLQIDRFDVRRNGGAGWRASDPRPAEGTVLSVLVDFVWGS